MPLFPYYDNISLAEKHLYATHGHTKTRVLACRTVFAGDVSGIFIGEYMSSKYYVVKEQALPEVLLKVVESQKLLDSGKASSVNEAVGMTGISRSSFYKYKEDIFEFHDNSNGRIINLSLQIKDEPGVLSDVLGMVARTKANILTIHQGIPINGSAALSLSIQVLDSTGDIPLMISMMEEHEGVTRVKMMAQE